VGGLGAPGWQSFHDVDGAGIRRYFADRQAKGFTVIQTVVLVELRSDKPNAFGHFPIEPRRPDRPLFPKFRQAGLTPSRESKVKLASSRTKPAESLIRREKNNKGMIGYWCWSKPGK